MAFLEKTCCQRQRGLLSKAAAVEVLALTKVHGNVEALRGVADSGLGATNFNGRR
jgi:hypothetical protein